MIDYIIRGNKSLGVSLFLCGVIALCFGLFFIV